MLLLAEAAADDAERFRRQRTHAPMINYENRL